MKNGFCPFVRVRVTQKCANYLVDNWRLILGKRLLILRNTCVYGSPRMS